MKKSKWSLTGWTALFFILFLFLGYIVIQYVVLDPKTAGAVDGKMQLPNFPFKPWLVILYVHIIFGTIGLLTGPFQFLRRPTGKNAGGHRKLGYIYVTSIGLAGMVGLYLSWYASGGIAAKTGFFMLDVCWLATTSVAMMRIFQKKFSLHQQWMIRSYAVTLAFASFRLYLLPFTMFFHLDIQSAMGISSWLCWITNLAVVEWYFFRKKKKKSIPSGRRQYPVL
ncbi:DUF2306 domain-containing protein [Falsibacillus pallidus]|uniref:DUF2306 domain-containing protein n=1 Tax=Falsibacillus pallidus TaxID=493781 RepID=UPI003D956CC6